MDLTEFDDTCFEEADELLAEMESHLLELDVDNPDVERLNAIFRAAHSIKGGAGTFGFEAIGEFTHLVETLLDDLRSCTRVPDAAPLALLLQSVEVLRASFVDAQAGRPLYFTAH